MSNGRHSSGSRGGGDRRTGHGGGSGHPGGAGGGGGNSADSLAQVLQSKDTIRFFVDEERKAIRGDLLDQKADETAKKLREIPASQLRRFFGSVMGVRRRLEVDPEFRSNSEAIRAELAFLKASSAYAAKRLNWRGDSLELVRMLTVARNSVTDARDFEAFARHFEAVVAFHKVYGRER